MTEHSVTPASAPPMVPSAVERASLIRSECWRLDAETEINEAFRDGWNAALAAQDERDQINFDEGRAFERAALAAAQPSTEAITAVTSRVSMTYAHEKAPDSRADR